MPRPKTVWIGILFALAMMAAGCSPQQPDKSTLRTVIDNHYNEHPDCVWLSPVEFPTQLTASDDARRYDALTDAGLLTRTEQKAKRHVPRSQPVNNYDLSNQGRAAWTPDPSQPGYGNFCFGHRDVTSVDKLTTRRQNGVVTASISYQYDLAGVPDWAKSSQVQSAFPNVPAALAGPKNARANLVKSGNEWQFQQGS